MPQAAQAGPDADAGDDLTFPISIRQSVGFGGKNNPADPKIVQQALNRFSSAMGRPRPQAEARRNHGAEDQRRDPGRIDMASVFNMRVVALVKMNGINKQGEEDRTKALDGADIVLRPGKIMTMPVYRFATRDYQICTLIHELSHYMGPPEGHADGIDDPPSGSSSKSEVDKLRPEQRPRIAECYSSFAFEAAFRREPLKVIV